MRQYSRIPESDGTDKDGVSRMEHSELESLKWTSLVICCSLFLLTIYGSWIEIQSDHKISSDVSFSPEEETLPLSQYLLSRDGRLEATLSVSICSITVSNILMFQSRCYNNRIPGPTLVVSPGDTLTVELRNNLERDPLVIHNSSPNTFRHPNTTSLHVHGLHVSPEGDSDNIYRDCNPGESITYTYEIPKNHPSGTFYYHPHHHGSATLQVLGGMAGAILVRDRKHRHLEENTKPYDKFMGPSGFGNPRYPEFPAIEKIRRLSHNEGIKSLYLPSARDLMVVLQRLNFVTGSKPYDSLAKLTGDSLSSHATLLRHSEASGSSDEGDNDILDTIVANGAMNPVVNIRNGELTRLRLVHAGLEDMLVLRPERVDSVDKTLSGDCAFAVVARDGVYLRSPLLLYPFDAQDPPLVMAPGSRADIAVLCTYNPFVSSDLRSIYEIRSGVKNSDERVKDFVGSSTAVYDGTLLRIKLAEEDTSEADDDESNDDENGIEAYVNSGDDDDNDDDDRGYSEDEIHAMGSSAVAMYTEHDLKRVLLNINTYDLTQETLYHPDDAKNNSVPSYSSEPYIFEFVHGCKDSSGYTYYAINNEIFNESHIMIEVQLGEVQEWIIVNSRKFDCSSNDASTEVMKYKVQHESHPFHIHTNHFKVLRSSVEPPLDFRIGEWRDTVVMPAPGNITIQWRAEDFSGKALAHCHVFSHADTGMTMNFFIADRK